MTRIHYHAPLDGVWGEHEMDYILVMQADLDMEPNSNEIEEFHCVPRTDFDKWVHLITYSTLILYWAVFCTNSVSFVASWSVNSFQKVRISNNPWKRLLIQNFKLFDLHLMADRQLFSLTYFKNHCNSWFWLRSFMASLKGPVTPWFKMIRGDHLQFWWDNLNRLKDIATPEKIESLKL